MKKKNLSSLYETILSNEKPTKSIDKNTRMKNIEELKELTTTPKTEKYNDTPHMNVLQPNYLQQADLLFLPTAGFGYKYLLVVVDANTLLCDAEPLKNKESLSVKKALEKIYKRGILKIPQILGVDPGSEFKDDVKTWADDNDVTIKTGHTNRHKQQALVEAKNKIIGSNLTKILASKELQTGKLSKDWVPYLRPLIDAINKNLPKPKTEVINDEPIITKNNYELLPIGTTVRVKLDAPIDITGKRLHGEFRSGDIRWSREIHKVENIVLLPSEPPMYYISDEKAIARTRQQLLVSHIFV
jgi:hypothetical protein